MTDDLWSGRLDASSLCNYSTKYWRAKHACTKGCVMEAVASFISVKRLEGGGGKPTADDDTVNYCGFTATDVDHMLRGRRWLLNYSLWSLTRSLQWTAFVAAFMNFITSASASFITADSDPIHLNRPRSDNCPFSNFYLCLVKHDFITVQRFGVSSKGW